MTRNPHSASIPRPVSTCDMRDLPIDPAAAYLLSRVDGFVSVGDLTLITGLSQDEVSRVLRRLIDLGAISLDGIDETTEGLGEGTSEVASAAASSPSQPAPSSALSQSQDDSPPSSQPAPNSVPPESQSGSALKRRSFPVIEIEKDVDLPLEQCRKVVDIYGRLNDLTHYELLGVDPTANKKEIKAAYYELASEFHPDKYFRKNLGTYKSKMEAIFSRMTMAHDTLTNAEAKTEYDAYVQTQLTNRTLETSIRRVGGESYPPGEIADRPLPRQDIPGITPMPFAPPAITRAEGTAVTVASPHGPEVVESTPPPPEIVGSTPPPFEVDRVRPSRRPYSDAPPISSPPRGPDSDRVRRETLVRKLTGAGLSRPPLAKNRVSGRPTSAEDAVQDLRRRYEDHQSQTRDARLKQYVAAAEDAMRRDDPAAAATAYRVAMELVPNDAQLREAMTTAHERANALLAEGTVKQARYEEKTGQWKLAARSYLRAAALLRSDPAVQERAANALIQADGDLHAAAQYAARAVELDPKHAGYRTTLAQVYLAAGLRLNARRELEMAAELAPKDANIIKLLKSVR